MSWIQKYITWQISCYYFLDKVILYKSCGGLLLLNRIWYRISSYSFRGNYSFKNLEIQRSHYITPNVTVHKCAETIQGRKLFKGGNYEEIRYTDFSPYYLLDTQRGCMYLFLNPSASCWPEKLSMQLVLIDRISL